MFRNRVDAGRQLGAKLLDAGAFQVENAVVLGLPRGGVPVAFEVAKAIAAPLDVIVVRKLGLPWQPELAMGAIGEDGVRVLNPEVLSSSRVSESSLAAAEARGASGLEVPSFRKSSRSLPAVNMPAPPEIPPAVLPIKSQPISVGDEPSRLYIPPAPALDVLPLNVQLVRDGEELVALHIPPPKPLLTTELAVKTQLVTVGDEEL